jgi:hypothetical protein
MTSCHASAQTKHSDKEKINQIVNVFMQSLAEKDSIKFYNLFYDGDVAWVGRFSEKSHQYNKTRKPDIANFFVSTYKEFFRGVYPIKAVEEKFRNVEIIEDGNIASVTFDYSFWMGKQKQNWGKEFWGLVKINDEWKITSVIFSMEYEQVNPEPLK